MKTKEKLKQIKYRIESLFFIIQRTLLSSFYKIKFPINKEVHCDSHVKMGRGTRIYFYNGKMHIKENTTICNNSKFIIGGGKLEIGKNVVIAAHSVVKGNFPDYCVCGGVPAHIIRQYNIKTGKWEKPYNK